MIEDVCPPPHRTLRSLIGWTMLGNSIFAACQWGVVVLLAKLGSPEMVGQYNLGVALAAPVLMFANLQLRALQATDTANRHAFSDYLALRIGTTLVAGAALIVCACLPRFTWETSLIIITVVIARCVEALSDVVYGHLQRRERMDRITFSLILRGLSSLLAFAIALLLTRNLLACVLLLVLAWSVVFLAVDLRQVRNEMFGFRLARWREEGGWERSLALVRPGLPMGIALMFLSLSNTIPRYFVEAGLGMSALGYFAAVLYPTTLFSLLTNAVGQSAAPRLSRLADNDLSAFWRLVWQLMVVVIVPVVGAVAAIGVYGGEILVLLYRPEYARYGDVFFVAFLAAGVWAVASILGYAATAARVFAAQAPLAGLIAGAALGSCVVLVPVYGLIGAAWSLCVSGLVACVLYWGALLIKLRIPAEVRCVGKNEATPTVR